MTSTEIRAETPLSLGKKNVQGGSDREYREQHEHGCFTHEVYLRIVWNKLFHIV
jgi:hypothetical protein